MGLEISDGGTHFRATWERLGATQPSIERIKRPNHDPLRMRSFTYSPEHLLVDLDGSMLTTNK